MSLFDDIFSGGGSKAARRAQQDQQKIAKGFAPYRELGGMAAGNLRDIYLTGERDFEASPGYDFRYNEGLRALENNLAARGLLNSGRGIKALQQYGQGIASDEYNQGFNRFAQLAGMGQNAVAGQGAALNRAGQYGMQGAANRASGYSNAFNTAAGVGGLASSFF